LLSCPNINLIYILLRSKNNTPSNKRLASLLNTPPFSYILNEEDLVKQKVIAIDGDITIPGLGLSEPDRQLLINHTNVVFHCAASVKFDDPLK
jgi:fatty acyl-CoA reductase